MPIIAVELSKDDKAKDIFNLTRLLYCVITVEPRRKNSDTPQCTNCQRIGHTKNYCHLPPRCVKCTKNHHYSQCTIKKDINKPACVNCGGEHTANYRGCPYIKQFNNKPTYPTIRPSNPNASINGKITSNVTYTAQLQKNLPTSVSNTTFPNNSTPTTSGPNATSNILQSILEILTPYLDQIKNFIISLLPMLFQNGTK